MSKPIRPLHDQVVIRPDPMESQTAGGIILTNNDVVVSWLLVKVN